MTSIHLLLALVVGISETCATNGNVVANGAYAEAVRKAGDIPVVICRTARPEDLDRVVAGLDLLIATGGEDVNPARYGERPSPQLGRINAARDEFEDQLLRAAVRHELPILGTCRGAQHLNVFFGGTLHQDLPSDLGARYTVEHRTGPDSHAAERDRRHPVEIAPGSRLARACGTTAASVNSLHHQAVKGLAPGLAVTAWTPDGVVEAIECAWYPAAGIQFHPECLNAYNADPVWEKFYSNLTVFTGRRPKLPPKSRPIGVFGSDLGGLAVLEKLLTLDVFDNRTGEAGPDGCPDFADEDFVYFADLANGPYERYVAAGKADFLRELVVRDAQFVLGSEGHEPSKVVVIACDTATACGLDRVKAMPRPRDADVIGIVNAGAENPHFDDPASGTAVRCYRSLRAAGLLNPSPAKRRRVSVFVSVGKDGPLAESVKYGRDCGCRDLGTRIVPLAAADVGKDVLESISRTFPACGRELGL